MLVMQSSLAEYILPFIRHEGSFQPSDIANNNVWRQNASWCDVKEYTCEHGGVVRSKISKFYYMQSDS